jgi:hypothetical protein
VSDSLPPPYPRNAQPSAPTMPNLLMAQPAARPVLVTASSSKGLKVCTSVHIIVKIILVLIVVCCVAAAAVVLIYFFLISKIHFILQQPSLVCIFPNTF